MPIMDCRVGERLWFDEDIRLHLTGRCDDMLFVFIDAARRHAFDTDANFHCSSPCRRKRTGHVVAMRAGDQLRIGPVVLRVEHPYVQRVGACPLRDVRLAIQAPTRFQRTMSARGLRRATPYVQEATC
jgi:hypothetical protein